MKKFGLLLSLIVFCGVSLFAQVYKNNTIANPGDPIADRYFNLQHAGDWTPATVPAGADVTLNIGPTMAGNYPVKQTAAFDATEIKFEGKDPFGNPTAFDFDLNGQNLTVNGILIFQNTSPVNPAVIRNSKSGGNVSITGMTTLPNGASLILSESASVVFGADGNTGTVLSINGSAAAFFGSFTSTTLNGNVVNDGNFNSSTNVVGEKENSTTTIKGDFTNNANNVNFYGSVEVTGTFTNTNSAAAAIEFNGNVKANIIDNTDEAVGAITFVTGKTINVNSFAGTDVANYVGANWVSAVIPATGDKLEVTFDGTPCDVGTKLADGEFEVKVGNAVVAILKANGLTKDATKYVFELDPVVLKDDAGTADDDITISYKDGGVLNANGLPIATKVDYAVTNDSEVEKPQFQSAVITASTQTIAITFDKDMQDNDATSANFEVKVGTGAYSTCVANDMTVAGKVVTLKVNPNIWPIENPADIKVKYTPGTMKTTAGAPLDAFTDEDVTYTNDIAPIKPTKVIIGNQGEKVYVVFAKNVNNIEANALGAFSITGTENAVSITGIAKVNHAGEGKDVVELTLDSDNPIFKATQENSGPIIVKYEGFPTDGEIDDTDHAVVAAFNTSTDNITIENTSVAGYIELSDLDGDGETITLSKDGKYIMLECNQAVKIKDATDASGWFTVVDDAGSSIAVKKVFLHPNNNQIIVLEIKPCVTSEEFKLYVNYKAPSRGSGTQPVTAAVGYDGGLQTILNAQVKNKYSIPAVPLSPIGILVVFGLIALVGFLKFRNGGMSIS